MTRDFTIHKYTELIQAILDSGSRIVTFEEFLSDRNYNDKKVILRHDVDRRIRNSLRLAKLEHDLGIRATYFFNIRSYREEKEIIREIVDLGHENGYHYSELVTCRGDAGQAFELFRKNLVDIRKDFRLNTICMDGKPVSRYDNRQIWEHEDYHRLELTGEPYFDIDYTKTLYLTDSGRKWNNDKFVVRDKVPGYTIFAHRSTTELIHAIQNGSLPKVLMINAHPERWNDRFLPWTREFFGQKIKNLVKKLFLVR